MVPGCAERHTRDNGCVPGAEQFAPPVYACVAGTVLHGHASDTLEPGVLLFTFLPPGAADDLAARLADF